MIFIYGIFEGIGIAIGLFITCKFSDYIEKKIQSRRRNAGH